MNRQLFRMLLLVIVFSMGIWLMSCGTSPQNTNQASNTETKSANTAAVESCESPGDIDRIMKKVVAKDGIKDQHGKNIQYRLVDDGTQKVLIIEGGLSDGKDDEPGKNREFMETMIIAVDELITKKCAFKAVFVEAGTLAALDRGALLVRDIEGFDWSSCEWPNIACSGGECKPSCDGLPLETPKATPRPTQTPSPNTNKNANSNANSNRLGNS